MNAPSHSINADLVLDKMNSYVEINKDDLRSFSIGPDILIPTDFKTFDYQHAHKTKSFLMTLIDLIKENKLYENSEAMAFLYGNLSHFVSDLVTHPMIYYMTVDKKVDTRINAHGLIEYWLDDYYMHKYNVNEYFYYKKTNINDTELVNIISELYYRVYGVKHEGIKYDMGVFLTLLYHTLFRRNLLYIPTGANKILNLGEVLYHEDGTKAIPYMNMDHEEWTNPLTGEKHRESFDDLFNKAVDMTLETIDDVNEYIYQDKELKNSLIMNNLSYNTGCPCEMGENFQYVKKYK